MNGSPYRWFKKGESNMSKHLNIITCFLCCLSCCACSLQEPCDRDELYSIDGECIKCHDMIGYHINNDNRCVKDTDDECGDGRNDCTQIEGVERAMCSEGKCIILSCDEENGFKLKPKSDSNELQCTLSILMDADNCGLKGYNCMQTGVKSATCGSETQDDKTNYFCTLSECEPNYHLEDNPESNENPWMPKVCVRDTNEACGSAKDNCSLKTGADEVQCIEGVCKIITCNAKDGYIPDRRLNEDGSYSGVEFYSKKLKINK